MSQDKEKAPRFKISGEAFETLKQKVAELRQAHVDANELVKKADKALWEAVYDAAPDADPAGKHQLNTEYEDLGFYLVEQNDCACLLHSILGGNDKKAGGGIGDLLTAILGKKSK